MQTRMKVGLGFAAVAAALGIGSIVLEKRAVVEAATTQAPKFEVNPMWPKPLPNHWVLGNVIGVNVDAQDHIWIIHSSAALEPKERYLDRKESECCAAAPPVLEFDEDGNMLASWGGPGQGYDWPNRNHGITVDYKGNVWIGGNGRGTPPAGKAVPASAKAGANQDESMGAGYFYDNMVLKFTQNGKFLMQIGKPGQSKGSNDPDNVKGAAKLLVDKAANELYVADGYGNHRVVVYDADTGKYKRHWGAYGHKPDDKQMPKYDPNAPLAQQFRNPVHCADLSVDGLLYVCDRANDRIQVFKKDGTYIKEVVIKKNTLGDGSTFDIAFSKDPQQKYMYVADGSNMKIHILERETLQVLTTFGDGGRQPGSFYAVHSIATDSKGNIFTTETYRGQRVQKFDYKGLAAIPKMDQGVVWPVSARR